MDLNRKQLELQANSLKKIQEKLQNKSVDDTTFSK